MTPDRRIRDAAPGAVDPVAVERFRAALARLTDGDAAIGLAVSGGPDSVAMLLLANAAMPGLVRAATVDHGLRAEAADEARQVARLCAAIGVPHATLTVPEDAALHMRTHGNRQAAARDWRLALLRRWCRAEGLHRLATAHHADDQAETLLMRLSRGAGVAGLCGVRACLALPAPDEAREAAAPFALVRPMLGFTKAELDAICRDAGIEPACDPGNDDPRYDRTRARRLLRDAGWLAPRRLAAAAGHLAQAEDALAWAAREEAARRRAPGETGEARFTYDMAGLPAELLRRLVTDAIARVTQTTGGRSVAPRGPEVQRAIAAVAGGGSATLGQARLSRAGASWLIRPAPPRRSH